MEYELVKQLKEVGFPQEVGDNMKTCKGYYITNKNCEFRVEELANSIYVPTLSELIEACGNKFDELRRIYTGEFVAETIGKESQIGSTPEEAVARLWLSLNNK